MKKMVIWAITLVMLISIPLSMVTAEDDQGVYYVFINVPDGVELTGYKTDDGREFSFTENEVFYSELYPGLVLFPILVELADNNATVTPVFSEAKVVHPIPLKSQTFYGSLVASELTVNVDDSARGLRGFNVFERGEKSLAYGGYEMEEEVTNAYIISSFNWFEGNLVLDDGTAGSMMSIESPGSCYETTKEAAVQIDVRGNSYGTLYPRTVRGEILQEMKGIASYTSEPEKVEAINAVRTEDRVLIQMGRSGGFFYGNEVHLLSPRNGIELWLVATIGEQPLYEAPGSEVFSSHEGYTRLNFERGVVDGYWEVISPGGLISGYMPEVDADGNPTFESWAAGAFD